MIRVNKYETQVVEHFDDQNNSLGFLNEQESLDLRCQIAEQKIEGYYLIYNDSKIHIMNNGKILSWPSGLYDTIEVLLGRLFRTQNP